MDLTAARAHFEQAACRFDDPTVDPERAHIYQGLDALMEVVRELEREINLVKLELLAEQI